MTYLHIQIQEVLLQNNFSVAVHMFWDLVPKSSLFSHESNFNSLNQSKEWMIQI